MTEFSTDADPNLSLRGELLVVDKPFSFWGGIDAKSGRIIDEEQVSHNQYAANKILYVSAIRGSTAGPGQLLEWLCSTSSPRLIVSANFEPVIHTSFAMLDHLMRRNINGRRPHYCVLKSSSISARFNQKRVELNNCRLAFSG